ncbi:hypothetical protein E2C01_004569 [Portunus trituberculatus]|uniref:Uncharacterized protein n=1 Tax=Portunus trituberculatus TaxID=210409 RepID=A0A5B7CTB9_PORTR|nr:hypothetical protein [Portunus trituberculatus]
MEWVAARMERVSSGRADTQESVLEILELKTLILTQDDSAGNGLATTHECTDAVSFFNGELEEHSVFLLQPLSSQYCFKISM